MVISVNQDTEYLGRACVSDSDYALTLEDVHPNDVVLRDLMERWNLKVTLPKSVVNKTDEDYLSAEITSSRLQALINEQYKGALHRAGTQAREVRDHDDFEHLIPHSVDEAVWAWFNDEHTHPEDFAREYEQIYAPLFLVA